MELTVSTNGFAEAAATLRNMGVLTKKGMAKAMREGLKAMRNEAVTQTRSRYYAKAADIRRSITLESRNNPVRFISRGSRPTLRHYKLTPTRPLHGRQRLKAAVKRTGLKLIPRGFIMNVSGGLPFMRTGSGRRDITLMYGPAMPQIIGNDETLEAMQSQAAAAIEREITRGWK